MTTSGSNLFDAVPPGFPQSPPTRRRGRVSGVLVVVLVVVLAAAGGFLAGRLTAPAGNPVAAPPAAATTTPATSSRSNQVAPQPAPSTGQSAANSTGVPAADGPAYLDVLKPVEATYAGNFVTGPEQIGTTNYPRSVRFTCEGGQTMVVYDVAGFTYLNATLGVPNDAPNGAGNTAAVTFFKDGSTNQLAPAVNDVVGQPQQIHLNLAGSAQLEIACSATNNTSHGYIGMDITLGNGILTNASQ